MKEATEHSSSQFSYLVTEDSVPSPLLLSLFSTHYATNAAAQAAFDLYHQDLKAGHPLAIQIDLMVAGANENISASINAYHQSSGNAVPQENSEALRLLEESEVSLEKSDEALWAWVKARASVGARPYTSYRSRRAANNGIPQAGAGSEVDKPKQRGFPERMPQRTFFEARAMATAISDGRDLRNWEAIEGTLAMLHDAKGAYKMQTRFEPGALLMGWWDKCNSAPELASLQNELQSLELDAFVTFHICLSGVLENPELDTSLDGIIAAIGRENDARRSVQSRELWRAKVWRWLMLFDSLAVVGARPGVWKEPRDGDNKRKRVDSQQLYSKDALLKIIGQRGTEQGTLDNSEVPKEVVLVAGPWARQWRGNREMLSEFGTLRAIAGIPRGKPSGSWATCVGFLLQQRWREQAAARPVRRKTVGEKRFAVQKFKPFTRRGLLLETWRSDDDVMKILESDDPSRARKYWDQAIKILQQAEVIGLYQEIEPLKTKGYGWQEAWLDQPLDIRPTGDGWKDAIKISESATQAKKRGRKPANPPGSP